MSSEIKAGKGLNALVATSLFLTGCRGLVGKQEKTNVSTKTPVVEAFTPIPRLSETLVSTSNKTEKLVILPDKPYPSIDSNLEPNPVYQEKIVNKLKDATEGDYQYLENLIKEEATRQKVEIGEVAVLNENYAKDKSSWTIMVKDEANKRPMLYRLTEGDEKGEIIRSMNPLQYSSLGENGTDYFDIESTPYIEKLLGQPVEYKPVLDSSGWNTWGAYLGNKLVYWFNADKGAWEPALTTLIKYKADKFQDNGDDFVAADYDGSVKWMFNKEKGYWEENKPIEFSSPEGRWGGLNFKLDLSFYGKDVTDALRNNKNINPGESLTSLYLRYLVIAQRKANSLNDVTQEQMQEVHDTILDGTFTVALPQLDPKPPDRITYGFPLLLQDTGKDNQAEKVKISPDMSISVVKGTRDPAYYGMMPSYGISEMKIGKAYDYRVKDGMLAEVVIYDTNWSSVNSAREKYIDGVDSVLISDALDSVLEPVKLIATASNKSIKISNEYGALFPAIGKLRDAGEEEYLLYYLFLIQSEGEDKCKDTYHPEYPGQALKMFEISCKYIPTLLHLP
jgi:hypothetical protein